MKRTRASAVRRAYIQWSFIFFDLVSVKSVDKLSGELYSGQSMPDRETFFITGFPGFIANRLLERLARQDCDFILLVQPPLLGRAREEISRIAQASSREVRRFSLSRATSVSRN